MAVAEAAAQADRDLRKLTDLWQVLGDRPFKWYIADTTGEALIRNSYFHPRNHIGEYLIEHGRRAEGRQVFEQTLSELRKLAAPGHTLGPALYNLACVQAREGRLEDALHSLQEGVPMRADLAANAGADPDFALLRDNARFKALVSNVKVPSGSSGQEGKG